MAAPSVFAATRLSTTRRILNQLARELLLAESSDWAFQIYKGTTVEYSSRRFQSHIHRFDLLAKMLDTGDIDHDLLAEIESRDNIFAGDRFSRIFKLTISHPYLPKFTA